MASKGIRDQLAVIGMGCTKFGELWDKGVDDLLTDATTEAVASVPNLELADIDAFWLGTMTSGVCGTTLSRPLKIDYKPVTRVENYCATAMAMSGSEAFRNACYAVASGAPLLNGSSTRTPAQLAGRRPSCGARSRPNSHNGGSEIRVKVRPRRWANRINRKCRVGLQ